MIEETGGARLRMDCPANYLILVQGGLDPRWSARLAGMEVTILGRRDEHIVTRLAGELLDQAALMGVLNTLYSLHLPLIAAVEPDRYDESALSDEAIHN